MNALWMGKNWMMATMTMNTSQYNIPRIAHPLDLSVASIIVNVA